MEKWFFSLSLNELDKIVEDIYYGFHDYVNTEFPSAKINSKVSWINWINFKQKIYVEENTVNINGSKYSIENEICLLNFLPKQKTKSYLLEIFLDNIYEKIIRVQTDLILYIKK